MIMLNQDEEIDKLIKLPLITDCINTIGMRPFKRKKRILGVSDGPKLSEHVRRRCQNSVLLNNDLSGSEFMSILGAEDILVLIESQEESTRRGNFYRVFPTCERVEKYKDIFEQFKVNNLLLWKFLKLKDEKGVNVLDELFKDKREWGAGSGEWSKNSPNVGH